MINGRVVWCCGVVVFLIVFTGRAPSWNSWKKDKGSTSPPAEEKKLTDRYSAITLKSLNNLLDIENRYALEETHMEPENHVGL